MIIFPIDPELKKQRHERHRCARTRMDIGFPLRRSFLACGTLRHLRHTLPPVIEASE